MARSSLDLYNTDLPVPYLPLDHPEPLASTLGVMLYPGFDEESPKRARAYAAQFLAEPIRKFELSGSELSRDDLVRIATDAGVPLDDIDDRWRDGLTTGLIFKMYFALYTTNPLLASWGNATKLVQRHARAHDLAHSRSSFYSSRSRYLAVAHLWGAFRIRDDRFTIDEEVGYEAWHDFQFFLAESEILRHWGQTWRGPDGRSSPPLPAEVWRVPNDWEPPERQPNWPLTGRVHALTVADDQLATLRRAGRPRGSAKNKKKAPKERQ